MMAQWSRNDLYVSNRNFTDFVHKNLAIPLVYDQINWKEMRCDSDILDKVDKDAGIDYFFKDNNKSINNVITIQERFRSQEASKYNDFTITYTRGTDTTYKHHRAEYYKLRSDFMLYGITNSTVFDYKKNCTKFEKLVIVDLQRLFNEIYNKTIQLSNQKVFTDECKVIAEVRTKNDENVTFLTFSVPKMIEHFGDKIFRIQYGYL